ncbi:MAG: hypothetical protein AB8G23_15000 [Myxococcota bacterium]
MTNIKLGLNIAGALTLTLALAMLALAPSARASEACGDTPRAFERLDSGDDESGIGGTGFHPRPPGGDEESGIGGTGIFGTVLRTERLCVNGFEIRVPETLQIESATSGDAPSTLSIGQIVFIRAQRTSTGLLATEIEIQKDLTGTPWTKGPPLRHLSIEGFITEGPDGPRLGGYTLDFGAEGRPHDTQSLSPGVRVRAVGEIREGGVIRITPPTRPVQPPHIDRAPSPPPKPERPERPERPHPERPERPALDERPLPRVLERPTRLNQPIVR